jgi:hypothetical protein
MAVQGVRELNAVLLPSLPRRRVLGEGPGPEGAAGGAEGEKGKQQAFGVHGLQQFFIKPRAAAG